MADSAGNTELVCTRVNRDLEIDLLVKRDLATAAYLTYREKASERARDVHTPAC